MAALPARSALSDGFDEQQAQPDRNLFRKVHPDISSWIDSDMTFALEPGECMQSIPYMEQQGQGDHVSSLGAPNGMSEYGDQATAASLLSQGFDRSTALEPIDRTGHPDPWNPISAMSASEPYHTINDPFRTISYPPWTSHKESGKIAESNLRIYKYSLPPGTPVSPQINDHDYSMSQRQGEEFATMDQRYISDDYSAVMSRTQSITYSEPGLGPKGQANDDGSVFEDGWAGVNLDQMEGMQGGDVYHVADESESLENHLSSFEGNFAGDRATPVFSQSAPAYAGAMFSQHTGDRPFVENENHVSEIAFDELAGAQTDTEGSLSLPTNHDPAFDTTLSDHAQGRPMFDLAMLDTTTQVPVLVRAPQQRSRALSSPQLDSNQRPSAPMPPRRPRKLGTPKAETVRLAAIAERHEAAASSHLSSSPGGTSNRRGGRTGGLSHEGRTQAALVRDSRQTCLGCKVKKIKCRDTGPCNKCASSRDRRPCLPAEWCPLIQLIDCGTSCCAHSIGLGRDNNQADAMIFDPRAIMTSIVLSGATFMVIVDEITGANYRVDLRVSLDLLSKIRRTFLLSELFGSRQREGLPEAWLKGIVEDDDRVMSSAKHARQCFLSPLLATFHITLLDKSDATLNILDQGILSAATSLSLIVLRARELASHSTLQKQATKLVPIKISEDRVPFIQLVQELGEMACTVRLLHSFCKARRTQNFCAQGSHESMRSHDAAQIIYYWYLYALRKRDNDIGGEFPSSLNVLRINGAEIIDPFPNLSGDENFAAWLADGDRIVEESRLLPLSPRQSSILQHNRQSLLHPHAKNDRHRAVQMQDVFLSLQDPLWQFSRSVP